MPIQLSFTAGALSDQNFDRLSRECRTGVLALQGVELIPDGKIQAPDGSRGDPVTLGTIALALVTSGTVTALFAIVKSYIERGMEVTFKGFDKNGKAIDVSAKNISFEHFRQLLESADVIK